jgi:hypothetical protein
LIPGVALTGRANGLVDHRHRLAGRKRSHPSLTVQKPKPWCRKSTPWSNPATSTALATCISAKNIDLQLKGDVINSGLMAARGNLSIDANNITNLAGTIKGMDVSLLANNDIQSIQANIVAGNAQNRRRQRHRRLGR